LGGFPWTSNQRTCVSRHHSLAEPQRGLQIDRPISFIVWSAMAAFFSRRAQSRGGNGGGGLGDLQVAAGVGQHDPLGRLARSARNGNWADSPAAKTVSNRSTATFSLTPCRMVTTPWRPLGSSKWETKTEKRLPSSAQRVVMGLSKRAQLCHHAKRTKGHHK
jgi:hypothetical protein